MSIWRQATWTNGRRRVTGKWCWVWHLQEFQIRLDARDPITGQIREFSVKGDEPEWGRYRLVESNKEKVK